MDNAVMETFFKTIKAELIWRRSWQTRRAAEIAIFEYINGFDSPRIFSRFEKLAYDAALKFARKMKDSTHYQKIQW